jgi:hypothetical protein
LASPLESDDLLWEILLRLQPQPSSLRRASAVCKRWRDLVADPRFLRSFSEHHRKPPLLGIFHRTYGEIVFSPMADPPDRIPPHRFDLGRFCRSYCCYLLDCRHGLALVQDVWRKVVAVCNLITGEQRCLAIPSELRRGYLEGAVLCASREHGHVHGGCHLSSYKVVLVSTGRSDIRCNAFVYSLETGVWGNLISTKARYELFYADPVPPALVGNCIYWTIGTRILEFDLDRNNLAAIMAPGPPTTNDIFDGNRQIIEATDGAVGYAILSFHHFQMWQRNINGHGVATWVPWKTIEMHTILRISCPYERRLVQLLWYDEDVAFLYHDGGVYSVHLKSMQFRKLNVIHSIGCRSFPFKSFFTSGDCLSSLYIVGVN